MPSKNFNPCVELINKLTCPNKVYQYQYQSILECTRAVIALGYIQPNEALSEKKNILLDCYSVCSHKGILSYYTCSVIFNQLRLSIIG